MSEAVLVSKENGVMIVTINRPEAKNAINKQVAEGISAAMDELDSSPDLQVAILTGAGGTFCSGMDLKAFLTGETPVVPGRGFAGICEKQPEKPVIAAIEGYALAGGFEIMLSCDLAVAADNAKFGIPEVKRGLAAGAGGLLKMPSQMPYRIALEMALTGDFITAQRAYEVGLINRIVSAGTALEGAKALAEAIAANGPLAVLTSKKVMKASLDWSSDEAFAKQAPMIAPVFTSEDAREGAAAFAQKRKPNWKGK
ncbi:MAG TPA: crotonase/enoyl-CoA hydratase family protein [Pseudomonadales bacterium]|nr:crotonase/enoyl-CoA hydratase family protein [Pseudomonadales bacterium]